MIMYLAVRVLATVAFTRSLLPCTPPPSAMAHLALGKAAGLDLLKHSSARHRVATLRTKTADLSRFCVRAVATGNGPPAALKVFREPRDYIVMMSSLNCGPSQPGRRPAEARHGR